MKEKEDDAPAPVPVPGSGPGSGMKSFIAKFLLDQTVGSVMNIVLFLVLINVLQGAGVERVWEAILVVCF